MSRAKAPVIPPNGGSNASETEQTGNENTNSEAEGSNDGAENTSSSDEAAPVQTVKMVRDDPRYDGPKTADVHPDEVANYMAADWKLADEPAKPE